MGGFHGEKLDGDKQATESFKTDVHQFPEPEGFEECLVIINTAKPLKSEPGKSEHFFKKSCSFKKHTHSERK